MGGISAGGALKATFMILCALPKGKEACARALAPFSGCKNREGRAGDTLDHACKTKVRHDKGGGGSHDGRAGKGGQRRHRHRAQRQALDKPNAANSHRNPLHVDFDENGPALEELLGMQVGDFLRIAAIGSSHACLVEVELPAGFDVREMRAQAERRLSDTGVRVITRFCEPVWAKRRMDVLAATASGVAVAAVIDGMLPLLSALPWRPGRRAERAPGTWGDGRRAARRP